MSLLEDVFLEDEAGEAQELERVIEGGDEYDERPGSPNSDDSEEKEDEAEEDKRRVDPNQGKTKRVIKNPRFILNPARLTGPRGIQVIPEHFKDFKFKGKGHEKEDLDVVLKKLEHWAYRLYPKFEFSDCLKKIETLGKKRTVMVHLTKIRNDLLTSEETVVQKDSSDEDDAAAPQQEDEFDKLLQQQIDLARSTPVSVKKTAFTTPSVDRSLLMPKATSSPSINEEQRERMLRNRKLAEERRLAKLKNNSVTNEISHQPIQLDEGIEDTTKTQDENTILRKHSRSNVIDSSTDEEDNESIRAEVHKTTGDVVINDDEINFIEEKSDEVRKHSRSNVIDSSSDEEMTINEFIAVEVHNKCTGDVDNNDDDDDIHTIKSVEEQSDQVSSVIIINDVDKTDRKIENDDSPKQQRIDKVVNNNVETNSNQIAESEKNYESDIFIINGSDKDIIVQSESNNSDQVEETCDTKIQESSKETGNKNSELCEEIMDVDLDDRF